MLKYGTPRVVRGNTQTSILRNVALLKERYPRQSQAQDMAIALNIASDVTKLRGHGRPRGG